MSTSVVIAGVGRTPIGGFLGSLADISAPKLGAVAVQAALQRASVSPEAVSEVILGEVLTAGVGQAPARQAALGAGIPASVPAMTLGKVCGSGLQAVLLASQSLRLGESEIVVAGGMESMSQSPYLLQRGRTGFRMGHQPLLDAMIHDGLWDPYGEKHMGEFGEACASRCGFSREQQDAYALESYRRASEAVAAGCFADEIVPVTVATRHGEAQVSQDEGPGKAQPEKIPKLKPAFDPQGTITAANASSLNDGAAALVLTTDFVAERRQLSPVARIVSVARYAGPPEWFTLAPIEAMKQALDKAGWPVETIDLFEINEAFAVVPMAAIQALALPPEKVNVWGGAIALGHPIGASGARILVTLVSALRRLGLKRGLAAICIGGGEAIAVCVERL
jgi:acetyl-CoA C-acetyltransferase